MKDIRKVPFRSALDIVPNELDGKVVLCPICKTETLIPWLEKLSFPQQPVVSEQGKGQWVPVSIPLQCSSEPCKHEFYERVPIVPNENRWALYGDEAGRYITLQNTELATEPLNFFCITLIGLHKHRHERVKNQIYNLKKSIAPDWDPNTWVHHFTDIWGSSPASSDFLLKNKEEKIKYAKKFAAIIRKARPHLLSFNISSCIIVPRDSRERKLHLRKQKEDIFTQSLISTLQFFREQEKSIVWIFDNVKDTTLGSRTEGWAAECFLGLQYTRLFTWLSAGATITAPRFVPPGSHFLLEIADFISYSVARDFEKSLIGKESEFPSSLFGNGFFQGTLGCGSVESTWSYGLPIDKFYGIRNPN